jgi:signal transduction histidine kinase/ActR/RegA family two-component response regulator
MNLKQRTFFFVAVSVAGMLIVYGMFSNYYVRAQEKQFFDDRRDAAQTIAQEFGEFFDRGISRIQMISQLPAMAYGLHALEADKEGNQIPAWTTLHYLTYQSDVFTGGVYLLNQDGRILWSEPPDVAILDAPYAPYSQIVQGFKADSEVAFTAWDKSEPAQILVASRLTDDSGEFGGMLVGAIPANHSMVMSMLQRKPSSHGVAQLVDSEGKVVASTDPQRQSQKLEYWQPASAAHAGVVERKKLGAGDAIVATASLGPSGWMVSVDQDADEALSQIGSLKLLLAGFGLVITAIAICGLVFILRSFTRPVEVLTASAKRIADGDLTVGFALDRRDEIGTLAKTLDEMKTKVKSSYDLLLASEKRALMGQIVAGIAHELNNPLTVVLGNTQLMLMREHNEANISGLKKVGESAQRAAKIVKNLLTFARQEKPERKSTDLNKIIKKTLDLHGYELKVCNIEVRLDLQPSLPYTMADPHQLQQVFLNLMVNAEQAMIEARGKGVLGISTRADQQQITVTFSDDGPGIKTENLQRIFEPFFTTKEVGKGTGLGLSISQGIIEEHGGKIQVDTTIGRGTTFAIVLPIQKWVPEEVPQEAFPPTSPTTPSNTVEKKRILVVEDEPAIQQLFKDVLEPEGHEVTTVENGIHALAMIDQHDYDLIFSDIKMPEVSGIDLYTSLKERRDGLERRVVFMTGDLMNPETLRFLEGTGCPWLGKPLDIESIKRTVSPQVSQLR